MASWNSKYAIWKDLSLVQGTVPAEIDGTIAQDERPPRITIVEETEEQFYSSFVGDGDSVNTPDLNLISKMLAEVGRQSGSEDIRTEKKSPTSSSLASTMFAKKKKKTSTESSHTPSQDIKTDHQQSFVPTSRAADYYSKFYERSKELDSKLEDIWSRAERQMREIEERRKLKKNSLQRSEIDVKRAGGAGTKGMDAVRLAKHRHRMLTDIVDCVVCQAMRKHATRLDAPHLYNNVSCIKDCDFCNESPPDPTPSDPMPLELSPRDLMPLDTTPRDLT